MKPYDIELNLVAKCVAFEDTLQAHEMIKEELGKLKIEFQIMDIKIKSNSSNL